MTFIFQMMTLPVESAHYACQQRQKWPNRKSFADLKKTFHPNTVIDNAVIRMIADSDTVTTEWQPRKPVEQISRTHPQHFTTQLRDGLFPVA